MCRGKKVEELQAKLERARAILKNRTIVAKRMDGNIVQFSGADFSYGVGESIKEAQSRLARHKGSRQAQGELKRGELAAIQIQLPEPLLR